MKYADLTPEQKAEHDQLVSHIQAKRAEREAAVAAKKTAKAARLADIPPSVNSVPALRAIVQGLIEEIRGD